MDPATTTAIITVGLGLLDFIEKRSAMTGLELTDDMVAARKVLRKALVEQAKESK